MYVVAVFSVSVASSSVEPAHYWDPAIFRFLSCCAFFDLSVAQDLMYSAFVSLALISFPLLIDIVLSYLYNISTFLGALHLAH